MLSHLPSRKRDKDRERETTSLREEAATSKWEDSVRAADLKRFPAVCGGLILISRHCCHQAQHECVKERELQSVTPSSLAVTSGSGTIPRRAVFCGRGEFRSAWTAGWHHVDACGVGSLRSLDVAPTATDGDHVAPYLPTHDSHGPASVQGQLHVEKFRPESASEGGDQCRSTRVQGIMHVAPQIWRIRALAGDPESLGLSQVSTLRSDNQG